MFANFFSVLGTGFLPYILDSGRFRPPIVFGNQRQRQQQCDGQVQWPPSVLKLFWPAFYDWDMICVLMCLAT